MTLYIQLYDDIEECIFSTDDVIGIPNVNESIMVNNKWYDVVERCFYFKHLKHIDSNSCTIFVKEHNNG